MRLPEHIRFDLLGDEQHGRNMWSALEALAVTQRVIAEDPRNWFSPADDRAPAAKMGFTPPQEEGGDELHGAIWAVLQAEDVKRNSFIYTVLNDPLRHAEPLRRWSFGYRCEGQVTQQEMDASRAFVFGGLVRPMVLLWMPDLATAETFAVSVRVHPPVEVHDHRDRRIRWVTDVTWTVVMGLSGHAPAAAGQLQICATCRWWGPLCGHPDRNEEDFKQRLRERNEQQKQGLEALTCLGWAGQPVAVAPDERQHHTGVDVPIVQNDRIETGEVFDHFATAPSSLLSEPS